MTYYVLTPPDVMIVELNADDVSGVFEKKVRQSTVDTNSGVKLNGCCAKREEKKRKNWVWPTGTSCSILVVSSFHYSINNWNVSNKMAHASPHLIISSSYVATPTKVWLDPTIL